MEQLDGADDDSTDEEEENEEREKAEDDDIRSDHSSDFQGTPVGSDDDVAGDEELLAPYETDNRMVGKIKKVFN